LRGVIVALAILYPLVAHLAVARDSGHLAIASVLLLAAIVLLPGLARGKLAAYAGAALVAIAVIWAAGRDIAWLPLYAPPVVISLGMAWTFGQTLKAGEVPLIERIVRLMHAQNEQIDQDIPPYARRLTILWTALFVTLGLVNLALALFATPNGVLLWLGVEPPIAVSRHVWSLFANLLNYVILAAFFVIEYIYRRYRFPQQPYANMLDFIRRASAIGPRIMNGSREQA
jgi:uncharacterized membrane protein